MSEHKAHHEHHESPEEVAAVQSKTNFGFWVYIMTDCVLFATLFVTYAVLHRSTYGGEGAHELFSLPFVLAETLILLTSSFTSGMALLASRRQAKKQVLFWFVLTFLLGAAFLTLELTEFTNLVHEGNGWDRSAFLSSFFTLVGTHGLHITVGLLWPLVIAWQVAKRGFTHGTTRRLNLFTLFWHFLDVVWIFIFTIVYLMGSIT